LFAGRMAMTDSQLKPEILWNERDVHHTQAEACMIRMSSREIVLLFGNQEGGDPENIRYTNRLILGPSSAKRLSVILNRVMENYEAEFGPLKIHSPAPMQEIDARRRKAQSVFRHIKTLHVPTGYERSFKMLHGTLLADRFLLGIKKKVIDVKAEERLVDICRKLGMPANLLETFRQALFEADYVHFGFEDDGRSCIYKVYVEFFDRIQETLNFDCRQTVSPQLLHLGLKWDPFEERRQAVTRYTWHPWITVDQIVDRVAAIADPARYPHLFESARSLVSMAGARMRHQDILYLEVTEVGNPRKSFDINVYRGGLLVAELYPILARLGQYHAIAYPEFRELYREVRNQRFGHLSGGIDRQGRDFCTVYHGAVPGLNRQAMQTVPPDQSLCRSSGGSLPVEQTDERAAALLRAVNGLHIPVALERSFKVSSGRFLPGRFLAGFERFKVSPESIFDICRQIKMPANFVTAFVENLDAANIVLFGFEKNGENCLFKAYLEFNDRLHQALKADPGNPSPFEIFTGFKWDAVDPSRQIVTRYTCYPAFTLRDMADRAAGVFRRAGKNAPIAVLDGILDLAAHRAGPREFLYFEASENNTQRTSFSINLYLTRLRMAEIYPLLLEMTDGYGICRDDLHRVYEGAKMHFLGNLAGGIDRQGKDFLTFYHAIKGSSRHGAT
jgi:hypothetical protein